jgi:hypothetical protein
VFRLDLDIRVSVLVRIPPQWAGRAASVLWLWASHLCFSAPLLLCSSAPLLLCSSAPLLLCSSAPLLLWISAPPNICSSGSLVLLSSGERARGKRYRSDMLTISSDGSDDNSWKSYPPSSETDQSTTMCVDPTRFVSPAVFWTGYSSLHPILAPGSSSQASASRRDADSFSR